MPAKITSTEKDSAEEPKLKATREGQKDPEANFLDQLMDDLSTPDKIDRVLEQILD